MSLIKSLIQRLLDSRTTPEEAGHSAMPSASETVLLTQNDAFQSWGNIYQGVAADDGYVNIFARSVNNTTSEMRVLTSGMTFSSAQTGAEKDMACSAPVAKGQSYFIKGIQVKLIKVIFVKALGAIGGGGYNAIIWRALSCLKPSFNFLLRSFSRVNGKQSKLGIFQKSETRLHSHQRQGKTLFTRLQRTDTFKSSCETARRVKNSPSLCIREEMKTAVQGRNSKILMDGFLYIYPFSRVKLSRFSAQELSQTLSLRSIRTTNPQTGGALC